MVTRAVVMIAAVMAAPLPGQWLDYPTAGIPRTPDGKPNLSAPAPKAVDGKPDLSGIWTPEKNRPCPPGGCDDLQISQEFINIAWGLPGGLPYRPWAAAQVKASNSKDDPQTRCLPVGIMKLHTSPLYRKIVQVPGLMVILNERNANYRQIFIDGRPLPVDPQPSYSGYSTAKWQGDTLVVESNGFRDGIWMDTRSNPLTEAAKVTERFHRVNFGKMEIEITVDDSKPYTKPWTVKLNHYLMPDTELLDYICLENEKDVPHIFTGK